ncbi:MAG: hypothetical protein RL456_3240 [Pseudomonadota bacterium]|jgi:hypothetical protein
MAYHKQTAGRVVVINPEIEQLRRKLPTSQYLFLLHQAGTTGYMPKLDDRGKPIPRPDDDLDELTAKDRVDVLKHLLAKTMPDAKYDHEPPTVTAKLVDAPDVAQLPSNELQRLFSESAVPADAQPAQQSHV